MEVIPAGCRPSKLRVLNDNRFNLIEMENMLNRLYIIIGFTLCMLIGYSAPVSAQQATRTVKGKVVDENGDAIIGATVLIVGQQ